MISGEQQIANVCAALRRMREAPRFRGQHEIVETLKQQLAVLVEMDEQGRLQPIAVEEHSDWLEMAVSVVIAGLGLVALLQRG
ncbi:MAG: hypothetical protein GX552_11335 [Chloroflexi bacterium]|nr:hypothetical protein [Chloroflexota bacterium]